MRGEGGGMDERRVERDIRSIRVRRAVRRRRARRRRRRVERRRWRRGNIARM